MENQQDTDLSNMEAGTPEQLIDNLARAFAAGKDTCEVRLSDYQVVVVTKEEYERVLADKNPPEGFSLTERIFSEARKKYEPSEKQLEEWGNILKAKMKDSEVRYIYEDDEPGVDIDGNNFDVEGKLMFLPQNYPEGVDFLTNEVGCVIDEPMEGKAIRLVRVEQPEEV